jgi:hypothetical protein
VGGGVRLRDDRAGGVAEQVDPLLAEVGPQGVDVLGEPVEAQGRRVGRHLARAGGPVVEHHQRALLREPGEVLQVGAGPAGAARDAHEPRAGADLRERQ